MCMSMKRIIGKCVKCAMACSLSGVGSVDVGTVTLRSERRLTVAMRLSRPLESRMTRLERPRRCRAERARGHRAGANVLLDSEYIYLHSLQRVYRVEVMQRVHITINRRRVHVPEAERRGGGEATGPPLEFLMHYLHSSLKNKIIIKLLTCAVHVY